MSKGISFRQVNTSTQVTREYVVSGAPVLDLKDRDGSMHPERAAVVFYNGLWSSLMIVGRRSKFDGTAGARYTHNDYYRNSDDIPPWALSLLEMPEPHRVVLAAMAADHLGAPMADMPAVNRKALDAVQWPEAARPVVARYQPTAAAPEGIEDIALPGLEAAR